MLKSFDQLLGPAICDPEPNDRPEGVAVLGAAAAMPAGDDWDGRPAVGSGLGIGLVLGVELGAQPMIQNAVTKFGQFGSGGRVSQIGQVGEHPMCAVPLVVDGSGVHSGNECPGSGRFTDSLPKLNKRGTWLIQDVPPGRQDNRRLVNREERLNYSADSDTHPRNLGANFQGPRPSSMSLLGLSGGS